ncbi:MAG: hypothetical protein Q9211_004572 [Gyalolechia sp. 1 TL-2023]
MMTRQTVLSCDYNPCDDDVLNGKGDDLRQAYYILESITRLHSYFQGLGEAFESASIASALTKDSWATTFYKDKDVKSVKGLKNLLNGVATAVGVAAGFAGLAGGAISAASSVVSALFNGGSGATYASVGLHEDNTFWRSADVGAMIGKIVLESLKSFVSANNILMHGDSYRDTGDIRAYLKDGFFLDFGGIDKVRVIDATNTFLTAQGINALWRTQKIFIMGGGACGDGQGIGEGPLDLSICRDGKAWYLYWWEEPTGLHLSNAKYGWTSPPMGSDRLGQGDYASITIEDVINSSLDAYTYAQFNYTAETAAARALDALQNGWGNPGVATASWEGVFTIPVCDVGWAIAADVDYKHFILQPVGEGGRYRPQWCGPVCSGDEAMTRAFIHAANMDNFKSPKFKC